MKRARVRRTRTGWWARFSTRVLAHPHHYWITALLVFVLSELGASFVYNKLDLADLRARLFQLALEWPAQDTSPKNVRLVMIGDADYWQGTAAGRRPLDRDYLTQIVNQLAKAKPKTIALDIDVRLPDPSKNEIPAIYAQETEHLIGAIKAAAADGIKVVLATPIATIDGGYIRDNDIYQINGLCPDGGVDATVNCGYIALPYDALLIPGQLRLKSGKCLDSFGLAIARAQDDSAVKEFSHCEGPEKRYTHFIQSREFAKDDLTWSAGKLLAAKFEDNAVNVFTGKAVIVGGNWSSFALGRGPEVDLHATPVGQIPGAMLHANYSEAFLRGHTIAALPDWFLKGVAYFIGVVAAVLFAGLQRVWQKGLGLLAVVAVLVSFEWIMLREWSVFFDIVLPVAALGLHSIYSRLFEGWEAA